MEWHHPAFQEMMQIGFSNKMQTISAFHSYMRLCEVDKLFDVQINHSKELNIIYMSSCDKNALNLYIPLPGQQDISPGFLHTMRTTLLKDHPQAEVTIMLKTPDSGILSYKLSDGLIKPPTPEFTEKMKAHKEKVQMIQSMLKNRKSDLLEKAKQRKCIVVNKEDVDESEKKCVENNSTEYENLGLTDGIKRDDPTKKQGLSQDKADGEESTRQELSKRDQDDDKIEEQCLPEDNENRKQNLAHDEKDVDKTLCDKNEENIKIQCFSKEKVSKLDNTENITENKGDQNTTEDLTENKDNSDLMLVDEIDDDKNKLECLAEDKNNVNKKEGVQEYEENGNTSKTEQPLGNGIDITDSGRNSVLEVDEDLNQSDNQHLTKSKESSNQNKRQYQQDEEQDDKCKRQCVSVDNKDGD